MNRYKVKKLDEGDSLKDGADVLKIKTKTGGHWHILKS